MAFIRASKTENLIPLLSAQISFEPSPAPQDLTDFKNPHTQAAEHILCAIRKKYLFALSM